MWYLNEVPAIGSTTRNSRSAVPRHRTSWRAVTYTFTFCSSRARMATRAGSNRVLTFQVPSFQSVKYLPCPLSIVQFCIFDYTFRGWLLVLWYAVLPGLRYLTTWWACYLRNSCRHTGLFVQLPATGQTLFWVASIMGKDANAGLIKVPHSTTRIVRFDGHTVALIGAAFADTCSFL